MPPLPSASIGRRNGAPGPGPLQRFVAPSTGSSLSDSFREIRQATEALIGPLAAEDCVVQSLPEASPTKWHLGHTSWFFEEFVLRHFVPSYPFFDEDYRYLFNSYYESVGPQHARAERGLLSRPTVEQTLAYRAHVDEEILRLLEHHAEPALRAWAAELALPAESPESSELGRLLALGLQHEQQHQELVLTDIKHAFFRNPLLPAYAPRERASAPSSAPLPLDFVDFDGGLVEAGHDGHRFGFDNELPRHRLYLRPFRIANRLITNDEYRAFVASGGYAHPEHWLSDGWATVQRERWERPLYWGESLDHEFTLTGVRELEPHSPVCHLSYYEADAFARWAGARLPTEFEWELAACEQPVRGNFVEERNWHPLPASHADAGGPAQMFGDAWEWTRSPYAPYPGYVPPDGALGEYNGKFMVNQLVLRGGSCVTPCAHIRATYRNFFPPSARWQVSGLRLATDI